MSTGQHQEQRRPLTLVDLPIELLRQIFRLTYLQPGEDAHGLAGAAVAALSGPSLTCRVLREACLPFLFEHLDLYHDSHSSTDGASLSHLAPLVKSAALLIEDLPLGSTAGCLRQAHRFENLRCLYMRSMTGSMWGCRMETALYLDPSTAHLDLFPPPPMLVQLRDILFRLHTLVLANVGNLAVLAGFINAAPKLEQLVLSSAEPSLNRGDRHTSHFLPAIVDAIVSRSSLQLLAVNAVRLDLLTSMVQRGPSALPPTITELTVQLTTINGPEVELVALLSASLRYLSLWTPCWFTEEDRGTAVFPFCEGVIFPRLEWFGHDGVVRFYTFPTSLAFPSLRSLIIKEFFPSSGFRFDVTSLCVSFPALIDLAFHDKNWGTLSRFNAASLRSYCRSRNITLRSNCLPPPAPSVDDLDKLFAVTKFVHARLESEEGQDAEEGMQRLADKVEGLLRVVTELIRERWDV